METPRLQSTRAARVALVEMPFGPVAWPSIGTSLLKAQLERAGHPCEVIYLNLHFLRFAGPVSQASLQVYHDVSDAFGVHLGEWIFGPAAFPDPPDWRARDGDYLRRLQETGTREPLRHAAESFRSLAESFLQECLRVVDWARFDVVGFANSYSQLNASLALARRLRALRPRLPLIIGGCGCSDVMGVAVLRLSDLFRAAAVGEADQIIEPLVRAVQEPGDEQLASIPGIAYRQRDGAVQCGPPKVRVTELDRLALPDYDDYFRWRPTELAELLPFYIPVEASRGCWWGQKSHCTFCGLNPDRMVFHSKTPGRFLHEIQELTRRHAPRRFMAVDNIMPHHYYAEVLPRLGAASRGAEFFFEVKANFRREQLAVFQQANVRQIQPGIESLSSRVLKLMGKGITGIANIYTLRLCREFDLKAHWSILFGFEGESREDYRVTAQLVERLHHLRPPLGLIQVEIERFAPMFRHAEAHGLTRLRPSEWYRYCHPVDAEILADLAYRFDADAVTRPAGLSRDIANTVGAAVARWRDVFAAGAASLAFQRDGSATVVRRELAGHTVLYALGPDARDVLRDLDSPRSVRQVIPELARPNGYEPYLDPEFLERVRGSEPGRSATLNLEAIGRAAAYSELLVHGLVVEEVGQAVSVVCDGAGERPPAPALGAKSKLPELETISCS